MTVQGAGGSPATAATQFREQTNTDTGEHGSAPAAEATAQAQKADPLAGKFAVLARREKQIREQQRLLEQDRQRLKAIENDGRSYEALKNRFKSDPLAALGEIGIDYDALTNALLNQQGSGVDPSMQKILARLEALEGGVKETADKFESSEKRAYEQALTQIGNEVKLLVDGDDRFETIRASGAHESVVELIKETFEKDGRLMSEEEAALEVETHLEAEALKMASLKKIQSKLTPAQQVEAEETNLQGKEATHQVQPKPQAQASQTMRTLTNQTTQNAIPKGMTEKERVQRAILAFKGQLK